MNITTVVKTTVEGSDQERLEKRSWDKNVDNSLEMQLEEDEAAGSMMEEWTVVCASVDETTHKVELDVFMCFDPILQLSEDIKFCFYFLCEQQQVGWPAEAVAVAWSDSCY